ncbi:MAG: penicillin acylase family protein [Ignavibacteriales bacterium]|nr:penicillin acylase family protein [Ignavibacteriales bacterium]
MKKPAIPAALLLTLACLLTTNAGAGELSTGADSVLVVRDKWGIPHIIAGNEQSLFYGAGFAAAEDRLLQMVLVRYSIQGRLAEFFGSGFVVRDKRIRTLGYYRHAEQSLPFLSDTTRLLLQAYADGVNAYIATHPEHMAEVFQKYGMRPEKWTAADGIACLLRMAERFDGGWAGEVDALRGYEELEKTLGREQALRQLEQSRKRVDDSSAVVSREEYNRYSPALLKPPATNALRKGAGDPSAGWTPPNMSHNWCVDGSRSTTGFPILESDPQITVESPATWYEFHLQGGRFNVRGIGMPGSPAMLIGYNDQVGWGLTALGSDNADLFQEQMREGSTTEYKWKDTFEKFEERSEVVKVKNAANIVLVVKSTRHGPVVNEFFTGLKRNEVFALRYVVTAEPATDVEGLLEMMAAHGWTAFRRGMAKYRSPGAHLIYADKFGNIAYQTLARLPLRAHEAGIPFRGWTGDEEWKGVIPFDQMPRMLNPLAGFISTANNCPIGSWFPYYVGGSIGDNARSWRLKELLGGDKQFSPGDFFELHRDAINPIARDFVFFALMAVKEEKPTSPDVLDAARLLSGWDYQMHTSFAGYLLVSSIPTLINRSLRGTPLENKYLGASAGLIQLFRDLEAHYDTTHALLPDTSVRSWLVTQLGECYRNSGIAASGSRPFTLTHSMPYQGNLEGLGSLWPAYDLTSPPLTCGVVETIWSQLGNSYSQLVNFAQIDSSFSFIPPGNSEVPASRHFNDQIGLWVAGSMHAAPLTLAAVLPLKETQYYVRSTPTSIPRAASEVPLAHHMEDSYPNPFNASTTIRYQVAEAIHVEIKIFNGLGQQVDLLVNMNKQPGEYLVRWTADLPSGVYYSRMTAGNYTQTKKLILLR